MQISNKGLAEIISYEAIVLTPYIDSGGVKTVGIGATKSDIPDLFKWPWNKSLTVEEAVKMFKTNIVKYEQAINLALKQPIAQHKFDALVSICYNIGTTGARNSTFMSRVNAGASDSKVVEAMKWWNKDNGKVVTGLVNRRAKEGTLYSDGIYSGKGKAIVAPVNDAHHPVYGKGYEIDVLKILENM